MKDSARANDRHALHLSPQSCHWEVAWHRSWRSQPSTSIPLMDMSLCCKAWGMDGWWARTMSHRFGSQSRIGMVCTCHRGVPNLNNPGLFSFKAWQKVCFLLKVPEGVQGRTSSLLYSNSRSLGVSRHVSTRASRRISLFPVLTAARPLSK